MKILGIESSCDETGVAIFDTDLAQTQGYAAGLLAHSLHSQIDMHQAYGGVVPELASRDHIRRAVPLIREVCATANVPLNQLDGIAYTRGPGLSGALLVGAAVAQSLAMSLNIPALGVHHLEGHLLSPLLSKNPPTFPFLALLVSGGHTQLLDVAALGDYTLLGESVDDAAGEAFDKTAKLLGLPYPGGPHLAKLAMTGNARAYAFPRPMLHSRDLNMSFAGLKTAVLTQIKKMNASLTLQDKADLAASFQAAACDLLVQKTLAALRETRRKTVVVAGGVGANVMLRRQLDTECAQRKIAVHYPEMHLCTDNGAMIALAGALRIARGEKDETRSFSVRPRWNLEAI